MRDHVESNRGHREENMSESTWFVAKDGQQLEGTYAAAEVSALVRDNPGAELIVWRNGMAQWAEPSAVPELAELLTPAPAAPVSQAPPAPAAEAPRAAEEEAGPKPGLGDVKRHMGFVRSLFDLKFEAFITPKMITTFYVLGMILVGIGLLAMLFTGLGSIISGFRFSRWGMVFIGLLWLVLAPVLSIIYLAFFRMFFELVMVLFKIKDGVTTIADRKS